MKKIASLALALGVVGISSVAAAADPVPNIDPGTLQKIADDYRTNGAGSQMSRALEYMEKERVAQQIEEDRAKLKNKIEAPEHKTDKPEVEAQRIKLQKLVFDPSTVLTKAELDAIAANYVGKDVTVKDLYAVVEKVNDLYAKKGYVTCRAFLLRQTITDGSVKITLVEGKTGAVTIKGNKYTKKKYIINRIQLPEGEIANINVLNKDMLRFNATNDMQLRIVMKAGSKPGTTDYELQAYEPQQYSTSVFVDNAGSYSSGQVREGMFYSIKSLTGVRDNFTIGAVRSKGTKAVSTSYSRPIGRSGTKLNVQYSTNSVRVVKGETADLGVKAHANSVGIGIVQPLVVNDKTRSELSFDLSRQNSKTDFLTNSPFRLQYLNDTTKEMALGFAMTNYGKSHLFYQKHSLIYGRGEADNLSGYENDNYVLYKGTGYYQKAYQHGQAISVRAEAQWSANDGIPSARDFYIGGMYSVRGYKENYLGSESGFLISAEFSNPLNDKRTVNAFAFFDYAKLYGEVMSTRDERILSSIGFGVKANLSKNIYSAVTVGFPLRRNMEIDKPSRARAHFTLNGMF